jgi:hypothetical protein
MKHELIYQKKDDTPEPKPLEPSETRAQYQRAFELINQKLFNNELPNIQIDFIEDMPEELPETISDCSAFFCTQQRYNPEPIIILDLEGTPEMGISTDTIDDLFHEMVHYYCFLHGIKDTDGEDNNYHNLAFKKVIEEHGGKCGYSDDKIGYSDTELNIKILWEIFDEI